MSGEIWALLSAAAWAVDSILVRKGTAFSNASTAAFVSFLVSVLFLVPFVFIQFPSEKIFHSANLYFVASGVIQPAMVRVLFYMGIVRLGVSRAGPVRGTAPLFTLALAFFVLHERPGLWVYSGAFLTVVGTWLVSYRREGEAKWRTLDLLFPLGAALLASVSQNIRKLGLLGIDEPLIASTVSSMTSFLCLVISLTVSGKLATLKFRGGCLPYYGAAALFALVGQLFTFHALFAGEVSVVSPIINTTPLFIILFTAIFLRGEEKVNTLVVLGSILLVAGIAVITGR
ncbi:MAG: DMT family transporter [Deltaproteobacteria bacterium]|nr:DMT family transporter [Deltaproteobacteria bacterium]